MSPKRDRPRAYDVVMGGQASTPTYGVVLGGLTGVKQRLQSYQGESPQRIAQRIKAIEDAINYGTEGLELVIAALNDSCWRVQRTAYSLLQNSLEPSVRKALQEYNPYKDFQCLYRHSTVRSTTYAIAITPDAQIIVSGGNDKAITLRHLETGKIIRTLNRHSDSIYALCLSPDGQLLASGGRDRTLQIWNLHEARNYNSTSVTSRTISDGLMYTFTGHLNSINCIAISPNGKILASGSEDGTLKLWNWPKRKYICTIEEHQAGVKAVAFSPDGKLLVSGSADHTINVWQMPQVTAPIYTLTGHSDWVKCLAISPDGHTLASGSQDKTICLWDLETGELKNTLNEHWGEVNTLAISPDGQTLISGGGSRDETIRLWHLETGKLLQSLSGHQGAVAAVGISPDGHPLVSSSWDHTMRVWGIN